MNIADFKKDDKILITDVDKINAGEMLWSNGDIVKVKDIQIQVLVQGNHYDRIEVWDKEEFYSEYIYPEELCGIEKIDF